MVNQHSSLKRVLGLPSLIIYGMGSILGAGIYTIIGEVAGISGSKIWISFLIALVLAILNSFNYAQIAKLHPESGAEPWLIEQAFGKPLLAALTGWLVLCTSIVSMATLTHAFSGYSSSLWPEIHPWIFFAAFLFLIGTINFAGIQESSKANIVATFIEFSGLLLIIVIGTMILGDHKIQKLEAQSIPVDWISLLKGTSIAFFAFIGFEDLLNVAGEVKKPKKHLPLALIIAPLAAGFLYLAIAWLSVEVAGAQKLSTSASPLLEIIKRGSLKIPSSIFSVIALFAIFNTALLNSITASRLLFGMSKQQLLPQALQRLHSTRKTPYLAIVIVISLALGLALVGSLSSLAGATSFLLLIIFTSMSVALIILKKRKKASSLLVRLIPILACGANLTVLIFFSWKSQLLGFVILIFGLMLMGLYHFYKNRRTRAKSRGRS